MTEKSNKALITTGEKSKKLFIVSMVDTATATYKMKMDHNIRVPYTEMNLVPGVKATLFSGSKMSDAGYVTILDKNNVKIYDGNTTKLSTDREPVLQGYRCKKTGLWRIPLTEKISNENLDTNLVYCATIREDIANVFELPYVEKKIAY